MAIVLLYLFLAVSIRQDQTPLRDGCDASDLVLNTLKAGEAVEIKFALAGSSVPCYKVSVNGQTGFVHASQLQGLEDFEKGRIAASDVTESIKITRVEIDTVQKRAVDAVASNGVMAGASKLIEANQPAAALAALAPELNRKNPDPSVLMLAGVAAWRGDQPKLALEYWKASLELRPDPALESLYKKVQREASADKNVGKTIGLRVTLRYESEAVAPEAAREMLDALDHEYAQISEQLGCRAEERITAIVQTRETYLKSTGAAEWSGGQYDGRIRIALIDERGVGPKTRRLFAHELVHACLASMGSWPTWFQEGVAQKLSGDRLSPMVVAKLDEQAKAHALPKLEALGRNWSGLTSTQAALAYALSLRAADLFFETYRNYGIRNVLNDSGKFGKVAGELDQKLGL